MPETQALIGPVEYASIDGVPITADSFDAYAAVLTNPRGKLQVPREQVLLSLMNQVLVEREAQRRLITVSDVEITQVVAAWKDIGLSEESLERSGGLAGLRERARMFLLFDAVKAAIVGQVDISFGSIEAEYNSDEDLHVLGLEAAAPIIRERLQRDQTQRQWESWLRRQRECARILVLDPSFMLASATPNPDCRTAG